MTMHADPRPSATSETTALEAKLFRGLSEPSRLSILKTLREGESSVTALAGRTGLSQPNVSAHLSCLRDCGLVMSRQEGRSVFYCLSDERLEVIFLAVEDILARVGERVYNCTRYQP